MAEEIFFYFDQSHFPAGFLAETGHTYSGETAGIDPGKRREIQVDIEGQAVKGNTVADGNADAAEFFITHPDPVVAGVAVGDNPACRSQADHHLFQAMHIASDG